MDYRVGMLVRNPGAPGLGLGKVLRVRGTTVDVFFEEQRGVEALKIRTDKVSLVLASEQSHLWLDNLPPFSEVNGRLRLEEGRLTQQQAIAKFIAHFPLGFDDPVYLGEEEHGERLYKLAAHELWESLLGGGQFRALLAEGNTEELTRRLLRVEGKLNLLFTGEKIALRDALKAASAAQCFFEALLAVIEAPAPEEHSFSALVDAVDALPQSGAKVATWPVVTFFPFIAQPDRHMFLKPEVTKQAEQRLGFHLNYRPHPNWKTYKCLLELSRLLMDELRPLGARDFIDVQSFIWVTAAYEPAKDVG